MTQYRYSHLSTSFLEHFLEISWGFESLGPRPFWKTSSLRKNKTYTKNPPPAFQKEGIQTSKSTCAGSVGTCIYCKQSLWPCTWTNAERRIIQRVRITCTIQNDFGSAWCMRSWRGGFWCLNTMLEYRALNHLVSRVNTYTADIK